MFFALSKILDVFLSPLAWAMVLVALSISRRRPSRRSFRRKRVFAVLALVVLDVASSGWTANGLWWRLEQSAPRTYKKDVTYDAVVLLGGIGDERVWQARGERAYNENVERLVETHALLRDGHARVAIISGGTFSPEFAAYNEAKLLASQLRDWGIPEDRLILEDQSRNTRENALFTAKILRERKLERVLVVTSAFHVPRSIECFRAVGLEPDFLPVDYRAHPPLPFSLAVFLPRTEDLHKTSSALREILGKYIYRLQGYGKAG